MAWRQQIDPGSRLLWDRAIVERVWQWLVETFPGDSPAADAPVVVAAYWPIQSEPDLRGLFEQVWARGWVVALPVVRARNQPLEFGAHERDGRLRVAGFGVQVPEVFVPVQPQVLLIPCVAFRIDGYRLGYGGGYYDRTLAVRKVRTVGVAYDGCEWPQFEPQPHDCRLDRIITPTR